MSLVYYDGKASWTAVAHQRHKQGTTLRAIATLWGVEQPQLSHTHIPHPLRLTVSCTIHYHTKQWLWYWTCLWHHPTSGGEWNHIISQLGRFASSPNLLNPGTGIASTTHHPHPLEWYCRPHDGWFGHNCAEEPDRATYRSSQVHIALLRNRHILYLQGKNCGGQGCSDHPLGYSFETGKWIKCKLFVFLFILLFFSQNVCPGKHSHDSKYSTILYI